MSETSKKSRERIWFHFTRESRLRQIAKDQALHTLRAAEQCAAARADWKK